jgi:hypothetical protein
LRKLDIPASQASGLREQDRSDIAGCNAEDFSKQNDALSTESMAATLEATTSDERGAAKSKDGQK